MTNRAPKQPPRRSSRLKAASCPALVTTSMFPQVGFADLPDEVLVRIWQLLPFDRCIPFDSRTLWISRDPILAVQKYRSFEPPGDLTPRTEPYVRFCRARDDLLVRRFSLSNDQQAVKALSILSPGRYGSKDSGVVCAIVRKFQVEGKKGFLDVLAEDHISPNAIVAHTPIGMKCLLAVHARQTRDMRGPYHRWSKVHGTNLVDAKTFAASLERGDQRSAIAILDRSHRFRDDDDHNEYLWDFNDMGCYEDAWHTSRMASAIRFASETVVESILDRREDSWEYHHEDMPPFEIDGDRLVAELESGAFGDPRVFEMCMNRLPRRVVWKIPLYGWRNLNVVARYLREEDLLPLDRDVTERLVLDHVFGVPERFLDAKAFTKVLADLDVNVREHEYLVFREVEQLSGPPEMRMCLREYVKVGGWDEGRPYKRVKDVENAIDEIMTWKIRRGGTRARRSM
ncbi:hypothetical protein HKX48_008462 [Thoreauomyces humboldtii]|nr:hypothetical protein HKX48_008462 [Thoreauomyces humboldtii]